MSRTKMIALPFIDLNNLPLIFFFFFFFQTMLVRTITRQPYGMSG